MLSFKRILFGMTAAFFILAAPLTMAVEEKYTVTGRIYCVLPTADSVKFEPGVCRAGDHSHVLKTKEGRLVLLQESPALGDILKLPGKEDQDVTVKGEMISPTMFLLEDSERPEDSGIDKLYDVSSWEF